MTDVQLLRKSALNNGVIYGVVSLLTWLISMYAMAGAGSLIVIGIMGFLPWIILIVVAILLSIDLRKKVGGFWSFKEAVTGIFIMFMASYVLSTIVLTIYLHLIDTGLMPRMRDNIISVQETFFSNQGLDQAKADEALEGTKKGFEEGMSLAPAKLLKSFGISTLVSFICALILAAIFKRERPLFDAPAAEE